LVTINVANLGIEKAIRLFRRQVEKAGVMREVQRHEFFVKPGEARRTKMRTAIRRARRKEQKANVRRDPRSMRS
jgi:small subunit ribosomal protein S21